MSARKLGGDGLGCSQRVVGGRPWSIVLKSSQTLRRHTSAFASATASATLTRNNESPLLELGSLEQLLWTADRPAGRDSASRPSNVPNATVTESLPSQEADRALSTVQRLSAEISRLVTELDTDLSAFLAANSAPTLSRQQQQRQQGQLPPSPSRTSSRSSTSSGEGARGSQLGPLGLAAPASAAAPADLPPLLSSLSLPAAASSGAGGAGGAGGGVAAAVGVGAESRAERRRQNWRRGAAAAAASSAAPTHEAKYKTSGSGSMTILMGSFSKDHILTAAEEQLLAAAAQDFMRLNDLTRLLSEVLRRPPSMAEMARSMNCEEAALRVRLDAGNRARTLLAQKNYRLVVSIAKRMVRPAGGGGGGAAGVPAAAGGTPALGDGGSSLDDAITVGMEALMVAIRKFKPEAGYRLSTYATWWIRQYVGRVVHAQAGVITMSQYQRVNLDRVRAVRAALRQRLPPGVAPSVDQIAEAAGLTPSQVALAESMERTFMAGARSFEAPLSGSDGDGGGGDRAQTVEDLVATEDDAELSDGSLSSLFLDSEDFAASASLASTVEGLLASLDRADCEALRREYGLAPAPGRGAGGEEAGDGEGETDLGLAASVAAAAEAAAAAAGGKTSSEGRKEAVGAAAVPAVKPGAERLQLGGRRGRPSAARALRELRLSTANDPSLAEWLELQSSKMQYAARTPGYAKKSRG